LNEKVFTDSPPSKQCSVDAHNAHAKSETIPT
jgi:hypothetical protein